MEESDENNIFLFCNNSPVSSSDYIGLLSISDLITDNIGYDKSFPLLGPYGIYLGPSGVRFQLHFYISGEIFNCCLYGRKERFARITAGLEPYFVWGKGRSRRVPGKNRNKPDPFRPGKQKKYWTDPPDSGFRSRSWHIGKTISSGVCPQSGLQYSFFEGEVFFRGSIGVGIGAQFNLRKKINKDTNLLSGWSLSGEAGIGIWGSTLEVGGSVHATATYGPLP